MKCIKCDADLHPSLQHCQVCNKDNGAPHVRLAQSEPEQDALARRVVEAWAHAAAAGTTDLLKAFEAELGHSQAVMVRSITHVDRLTRDDGDPEPIRSFYNLRDAGVRRPTENFWDRNRQSQDSRINPDYHENLNYAVLSLDGLGPRKYGRFHITWRDIAIEDRAAVFEENPFRFNARFPIHTHPIIPSGYRASWPRRSDLAIAKLHARIVPTTQLAEFAGILVEPDDLDDTDFIEVHIDGALFSQAIERVIAHLPLSKSDGLIWKSVKRRLKKMRIATAEVTV